MGHTKLDWEDLSNLLLAEGIIGGLQVS
jgi:hypothetical protein